MNIWFGECEFCGKQKNITGTTQGCFCEDCLLNLVIEFQWAHEAVENYNENSVINKLQKAVAV
jgi:hypothetical protein